MNLPEHLKERLAAALADTELLSAREDVALIQAAIDVKLTELNASQPPENWEAVIKQAAAIGDNWRAWDWARMQRETLRLIEMVGQRQGPDRLLEEVFDLVERKAKLAQMEHKRMLVLNQFLTVEQALVYAQALSWAVTEVVDDDDKLRVIAARLRELTGRVTSGTRVPMSGDGEGE